MQHSEFLKLSNLFLQVWNTFNGWWYFCLFETFTRTDSTRHYSQKNLIVTNSWHGSANYMLTLLNRPLRVQNYVGFRLYMTRIFLCDPLQFQLLDHRHSALFRFWLVIFRELGKYGWNSAGFKFSYWSSWPIRIIGIEEMSAANCTGFSWREVFTTNFSEPFLS